MNCETEFNGDKCVVLPVNYLSTPQAASELYEEELAEIVTDLNVRGLGPSVGQATFRLTIVAWFLWLAPGAWMLCF